MSSKATVKEYMDYTTFHGLGRLKNSPYLILKVFWILVMCASFSMISWQIHGLFQKYKSYPISTSVEVKTESSLMFPRVVICNTNPAKYWNIRYDSKLEEIITNATEEHSFNSNIFNISDIYDYNFTDFDMEYENKPIRNDILLKTSERFKMSMSVLGENTLRQITQSKDEFMLLCNFAGEECSPDAVTPLRTYDYGICYMFQPGNQSAIKPDGEVSAVGPRYSLELLLNIDQGESVPFVTSSTGAVIGIQFEDRNFHPEQSVFIPTGFETNIALTQVRQDRVPGKKERKRCKASGAQTLLDCQRKCMLQDIEFHCGCYRFFFDISGINSTEFLDEPFDEISGQIPCNTESHYRCIQKRLTAYITDPPKACVTCLAPCKEIVYERDISMVAWPNEHFVPILRRVMTTKLPDTYFVEHTIDRDFVRGNLALVRIYLSSLSYQLIKEEYTYSEIDFISDIGGQLGLWVGCSVLSVLEVVELIVLIVASVRGEKKTGTGDQDTPDKDKENGQRIQRKNDTNTNRNTNRFE